MNRVAKDGSVEGFKLKLKASKTTEVNSRATDKVTRSAQAPDESFCRFFIYFSPFPPVVSAFWLLLMERHLWPFTGVLSEIGREVTGTNAGIFQTEGNEGGEECVWFQRAKGQALYGISITNPPSQTTARQVDANEHQFIRISVDSWLS